MFALSQTKYKKGRQGMTRLSVTHRRKNVITLWESLMTLVKRQRGVHGVKDEGSGNKKKETIIIE
jgi:hypothetical protein